MNRIVETNTVSAEKQTGSAEADRSHDIQHSEMNAGQLQQELQQGKPFASPHVEAFLALQRTASLLMQKFSQNLRAYELTPTQYNVLRILRGARPEALTCSTIGDRLVTPGPDVTRLVDRLVRRGLVDRRRDSHDRRVVRVRIDAAGVSLLAQLDAKVLAWIEVLLGPLPEDELASLIALLGRLRSG